MTHTVCIEGLKIETVIGVYDWERAIDQLLVVDLKLHGDMSKSFASDDVGDVMDYQKICDDVERICHESKAHVLEYLANKIVDGLLAAYPCSKVEIHLKKPHAIKKADSVGVVFAREKAQ